MFLAQDEYKKPAHDDCEGLSCACGKDLAACGACGRGWAQRGAFPLVNLDSEEEGFRSVVLGDDDFDPSLWVKPVDFEAPAHIPKRSRFAAVQCNAQPKVKSKPEAHGGFKREVASRTAEDRQRLRLENAAAGGGDQPGIPWDARGPERAEDGSGPSHWRGQRFRPGSGRYANSGGKHREKFVVWHNKKQEGLRGQALEFWHPYQRNGYWEQQARALGIASPRDDRERAEKRAMHAAR